MNNQNANDVNNLNTQPIQPEPVQPVTTVQPGPTPQPVPPVVNTQPINTQPMQNTGYNQVPYGTPQKKSNNALFAVIISLLALIILGLLLYLFLGDKLKGSNTPSAPTNPVQEQQPSEVVQEQSSKFTLEGYEMTIPAGYTTKTIEGEQYIVNQADKVIFAIPTIMKYVSYSDFVAAKEALKSEIESSGITVSSYAEKTYGGKNWLIYDYTLEGVKMQMAFTSFDTNHVFAVDVMNVGTKAEQNVYNDLNTMLGTAKNNGASSFASETEKGEVKVNNKMLKPSTSALN